MKQGIQLISIVVCLAVGAIASGAETSDLALSLRQRTEKGEVVLDILVSNVSTGSVEIVSGGIAPPWSVWAWFDWQIDGRPAKYMENVASIPAVRESWRIPPDGTILWSTIPLRLIEVRTKDGYDSGVKDDKRHTIAVLPTERWKTLKVGSGTIEIGK